MTARLVGARDVTPLTRPTHRHPFHRRQLPIYRWVSGRGVFTGQNINNAKAGLGISVCAALCPDRPRVAVDCWLLAAGICRPLGRPQAQMAGVGGPPKIRNQSCQSLVLFSNPAAA